MSSNAGWIIVSGRIVLLIFLDCRIDSTIVPIGAEVGVAVGNVVGDVVGNTVGDAVGNAVGDAVVFQINTQRICLIREVGTPAHLSELKTACDIH